MGKTVADPGGDFVTGANSWIEFLLGLAGITAAFAGIRRWWRKRQEDRQRRTMSVLLAAIEEVSVQRAKDHEETRTQLLATEHRLAARLDLMEAGLMGSEQRFNEHVTLQGQVVDQLNSRFSEAHDNLIQLIHVIEKSNEQKAG